MRTDIGFRRRGMRRIRFKRELIEAIRRGEKTMTFRTRPRARGVYLVEEGGHPRWRHIDAGIVIEIKDMRPVSDVRRYAEEFYRQEGFNSPEDFLSYARSLYKHELPRSGWTHIFEVLELMGQK